MSKVVNIGIPHSASVFKVRVFDAKSGKESTGELSIDEKREFEQFFQNRIPNVGDAIHANHGRRLYIVG